MRIYITTIALALVAAFANANTADKHQTSNLAIEKQLQLRKSQFKHGIPDLLKSADRKQNTEEYKALSFLAAFMPLSDITMHSGAYVQEQIKVTLEAKKFFSWGSKIPEDIFNHFVLPYRINNEYTDDARKVFFAELKNRIKGMSMYDAALEVNHWCHEKVTYRSTDERTSGPLTAVRTAFGRCGEESTFTVAALRSVGIPARQVYTPRWAHTDDNHAWVEVWIDGKWHFLGACEPEAELDLGWFAAPAKRAMMTHTVVFGQYQGKEESLQKEPLYTRINLLANYTNTRNVFVKVVDANGKPAPKAKVEFMVYNYSEFYPIGTKYTDAKGNSSLETGYGDLIAWASSGELYGYSKISGKSNDTVTVTIAKPNFTQRTESLELIPPKVIPIAPVNSAKAAINNRRLHEEDSIRNSYVATFIDSAAVAKIAAKQQIDIKTLLPFFKQSRGNWREIEAFVGSLTPTTKTVGIGLLASLAEKDFHDITAAILTNHLNAIGKAKDNTEMTQKYVWGLRVGKEMITTWRSFLQKNIPANLKKQFAANPSTLVAWIKGNITIDTVTNYYNVPLSPEAVYSYRIADKYSRNLFFVTVCRSLGVAARFEPATLQPQYNDNGVWKNAQFETAKAVAIDRGKLVLTNASADPTFTPKYYSHFTVAKFQKGQFVTLDYEGSPEVEHFPCTLNLEAGFYRVMTGNRQNDGTVLCNISYFTIEKDKSVTVPIELRPFMQDGDVLGKADMEANFTPLAPNSKTRLSDYVSDKGVVVAVIDPDKEPTKHLIEDLKAVKQRLDQWGGYILLIVKSGKLTMSFNTASYSNLPKNIIWGYDASGDIGNAIDLMCGNNGGAQAPQVSVINGKGEIGYYSEGYSISLGETILKNLHAK